MILYVHWLTTRCYNQIHNSNCMEKEEVKVIFYVIYNEKKNILYK